MKTILFWINCTWRFVTSFIILQKDHRYRYEIEILPLHVRGKDYPLLSFSFVPFGRLVNFKWLHGSEFCGFDVYLTKNSHDHTEVDVYVRQNNLNGSNVNYLGNMKLMKEYTLIVDYEQEEKLIEDPKIRTFNYHIILSPSTYNDPTELKGFNLTKSRFGYIHKQ